MGIVSRLFDSIAGIYWFPIIALALFIVFFGLMAIHTMTMKKSKEKECSSLPFENDENYHSREV
jgi:hypothetical protein